MHFCERFSSCFREFVYVGGSYSSGWSYKVEVYSFSERKWRSGKGGKGNSFKKPPGAAGACC